MNISMWQLMFLSLLLSGSILSISSNSWFSAWVGLEVNLMALIPLLSHNKSPRETEAAMKYFLAQTFGSLVLITGVFITSTWPSLPNFICEMVVISALLIKLGAAPFHFWVPPTVEGSSWSNATLLLTWQKLAPFILLTPSHTIPSFLKMSIGLSAVLGALGGLNQIATRKIIAFSSIAHSGWMILASVYSKPLFLIYFSSYTLILFPLMLTMKSLSLNFIHQGFFKNPTKTKITLFFPLISLAGLPPFLGFTPKWMIISHLSPSFPFLISILIISTMMTLFFYIQLTFNAILVRSSTLKINPPQNSFWLSLSLFSNLLGLFLAPFILSFFH